MAKKNKIPEFTLTPSTDSLQPLTAELDTPQEEGLLVSEPQLENQTMDIVFNTVTKTWDKVFISYNLETGEAKVIKTSTGHSNPLVMQQEMSKYFFEKLVTKRKM